MSEPRRPSRRDFLTLAAGAFVVAALPVGGRAQRRLVRRSVPAMGAVADLAVVHADERYAQRALGAAVDELLRVEALMTRFRPDSDVGRANQARAGDPVAISADTHAVLEEALRWSSLTTGGFDPCLERVTELWDVKHRHAPPAPGLVRPLAGRRLYRAVELDRWRGGRVVRLTDPDARLDLGGIACGYGVDRVVAVLRDWGIRDGFVNVGGDIFALGVSERGEPWAVGIRSPDDPNALIGMVRVSDRAIATSGDYTQFFAAGGRRYHHIMDPGTAAPRRSALHSVTVAADRCVTTDAATTACFGLAEAHARALLARAGGGAELINLA